MVWTVLLQDVAQLINISWTHILFDNEVFKTKLLLNYKKIMVTFCRISVNPVSKYLKDVLSEVSSQATNLHSDINRHQNTSMDFLHSNFFQINDNVTPTLIITTLNQSKMVNTINIPLKYVRKGILACFKH